MHRFLMMVAVVALLPGCVSNAKYDALKRERDMFATQSAALARDTEKLADVAAALDEELTIRDRELAQLQATQAGLREELEAELAAGRIKVQLMRDGLHVQLAESVLFPTGSAELTESGRQVLFRVIEELEEIPFQIGVLGYTDDVPIGAGLAARYPSHWELAGARSASVVRLMEEAGIDPTRLVAVSFGANNPIASNETLEGRARNRRIDIRLRPVIP
jgi:chemotaxis protein MotB